MRLAARGGLAIVVVLCGVAGAAAAPGYKPIDLVVRPIDYFMIGSSETRFGALEFRGGLELSSPDKDFGSLSGLAFSEGGSRLTAVADTGLWFTARPLEENGRLVGLAEPRLAPILDAAGNPLVGKHEGDAEGLRILGQNGRETALVSFERVNEVRRFAAHPDLADARPVRVQLPSWVKGIRRNTGLEAIAVAPPSGALAGATVLLTERSLDKAGNHRGFILGGPHPGAFALKRSDDYDVTDAVFLDDGGLLVLERRLSLTRFLGMRIRRISGGALKPGATVDGEVLIETDVRHRIDNMEGIAATTGANGETLIALVSDDNGSPLQRTLLLYFALAPETRPAPATTAATP